MASSEELNGRAFLGGSAGEEKADAAILLPLRLVVKRTAPVHNLDRAGDLGSSLVLFASDGQK